LAILRYLKLGDNGKLTGHSLPEADTEEKTYFCREGRKEREKNKRNIVHR